MCLFQTFLQKGKEMGVNQSMGQHLKVKPTCMFDVKIRKMHCCVTTILIALKLIENILFWSVLQFQQVKRKIKLNQILQSSISRQAVAESIHFKNLQ